MLAVKLTEASSNRARLGEGEGYTLRFLCNVRQWRSLPRMESLHRRGRQKVVWIEIGDAQKLPMQISSAA